MRSAVLATVFAALLPSALCAQWQMQTSNTTADLRGIANVGGGVAWASGTHGTVLRTEDGGYVWQTCAVPAGAEKLDFRGVQAFDANTAIVMSSGPGDLSRLYKTTDGCQTWKLVFTNPDKEGFWDAIQFYDRSQRSPYPGQTKNGMLIGDPVSGAFVIFLTRDGGKTWKRWNEDDPKHQPKSREAETLFAASNQALIVPGINGPFAFVTGGSSTSLYVALWHSPLDARQWQSLQVENLPCPKGQSAGAFAIAARRSPESPFAEFVIVGGDYAKPNEGCAAFISGEPRFLLGSKGTHAAQSPPRGYRSAVAYDSDLKLWITVGPNGTDVSSDDGRNWRAVHPDKALGEADDADRNWNALSLPFVVGPHGRIGKLEPAALALGVTGAKGQKGR